MYLLAELLPENNRYCSLANQSTVTNNLLFQTNSEVLKFTTPTKPCILIDVQSA